MAVADLEIILQQADSLRADGQYYDADPLYRQILNTDPRHLDARLGLAHCLLNVGDFDASVEQFRLACENHPASVQALMLYAKMLLMLGNVEEGRVQLNKVLELDPDNDEAKRQLDYCR